MGLLTPGYHPSTYWPLNYLIDDYWPDFGDTPFPLTIVLSGSLEYGVQLTDSAEYTVVLSDSAEFTVTLSHAAGGS